MSLSRLDLDGLGSPRDIAARIHELAPNLAPNFSVHDLCRQLDIDQIEEIPTDAFEAALVMDANKASGSIFLAKGRPATRHRFSIGHELGHFLIPTHMPRPDELFQCSLADLHLVDAHEKNRRNRIEAEANRFAAALLMPPVRLRRAMTSRQPHLGEICDLATQFGMSKEAMARAYVEAHRQTIAVLILQHGLIKCVYRQEEFPGIAPWIDQPVPHDSIASDHRLQPQELSQSEECEPEVWFEGRNAARVEVVTEQLYGQSFGFSMLLLHVELADD